MSDVLKKFINDYQTDLMQISHTERVNKGLGIMLLNIVDKEMKCSYFKIDDPIIPENIRKTVIEMNNKKNSDVYFYFNDKENPSLITLDLDKRNSL